MNRAGVDTVLRLHEDPWKIRKQLTASDVDHSSRLLLQKGCVETHVLPWMPEERRIRVKEGENIMVTVRDEDKDEEHLLVFRYLESGTFQLNKGWKKLFVNRRGLEVGDEIGMYWDNVDRKLQFTVLRRVAHDWRFHD